MFFDDPALIPELALRSGTSIFTAGQNSDETEVNPNKSRTYIPHPYFTVSPGETGKITIDQARDLIALTETKQKTDQFIVIDHAEKIQPEAENAILKLLEEPREHYHFVLFTSEPHLLLPTILSRASLYILREPGTLKRPPAVDPRTLDQAKRLLVATPRDLPALADEIAKKPPARDHALAVVGCTIELTYKSYFATNKAAFLQKLPKLLKLYDNLQKNGHVKLHLVADLV